MVLRAKCCDGETGPLPIAIPGGRPRLQEAGLSGESKWLPELPLAREASIVLFWRSELRLTSFQAAPGCGLARRPQAMQNIMSSSPVYSFYNFQSPYS